jgi:hypothetical protein
MGCDIHAMWERKKTFEHSGWGYWINSGDPDINRNYTIFAILGDVRNDDGIPAIGSNRFNVSAEDWAEEEASDAFVALVDSWKWDGHSHSWVTLKELKEYDTNQTYHSHRLICGKDEDGNITSTCAWSSGETFGEVGETTVFGVWGDAEWQEIIKGGEAVREQYNLSDDEVRLVFFFDN